MSKKVLFDRTGGTEVLEIVEVLEPHPAEGQVRVAVVAAALNPFDSKVRQGTIPAPLPSGQGGDFAGVVDEIGAGVTDVAVGDEVIGWTMHKAQADYVIVPAANTAPKPASLSWEVAASIGVVVNTARRAVDAVALTSDDTLYISGIAGGVGLVAAQFAVETGCSVIGTARDSNHDFVRSIGAVPVGPGDGVVERLLAAASGRPFTAAVDTVGRQQVEVALALGVQPGRVNSVADHDGPDDLGTLAVGGGKKSRTEMAGYAADLASGKLMLPIRARYPLERVREAYDELDNGHGLGKIVLIVAS